MIGSYRTTKAEWYNAGGFANPRCWRRHNGRHWEYYVRIE